MAHTHKPGMTYYTTGDDTPQPMHIFAAWSDVTERGRNVLVGGHDPQVPASMLLIPAGTEFIIPKTVRALAEAGSALMAARTAEAEALAAAKRVALKALADGVTEVDVSRSLGVDRMTVRKWAGKRPSSRARDQR